MASIEGNSDSNSSAKLSSRKPSMTTSGNGSPAANSAGSAERSCAHGPSIGSPVHEDVARYLGDAKILLAWLNGASLSIFGDSKPRQRLRHVFPPLSIGTINRPPPTIAARVSASRSPRSVGRTRRHNLGQPVG